MTLWTITAVASFGVSLGRQSLRIGWFHIQVVFLCWTYRASGVVTGVGYFVSRLSMQKRSRIPAGIRGNRNYDRNVVSPLNNALQKLNHARMK
jgi:hypothetical protein